MSTVGSVIMISPDTLNQIVDILDRIATGIETLVMIFSPVDTPTAILVIHSSKGATIDMTQSTLKSMPGTGVLTFQVFDNSTPPQDITTRCTFTATSDGPAVVFGAVSGATVPVTYSAGSANVAFTATDSGGDTIVPLNLVATITVPVAGTITVTDSNPATKIA
jgi:hypothetical protein